VEKTKPWLQREALPAALYALAVIVLTLPVIHHLGGYEVALHDIDGYFKLWDNWWFIYHLKTGSPAYFTTQLFYPNGLNMAFNNFNWVSAAIAAALRGPLGPIGAFNALIPIALFLNAVCASLFARALGVRPRAAWFAGLIYGLSPYFVRHAGGHPDLSFAFPIPLTLLFLKLAADSDTSRRLLYAAGAGIMTGAAALISMYILDMLAFTVLGYGIALLFERKNWRRGSFWAVIGMYGGVSAALALIRLWPMLANLDLIPTLIRQKQNIYHGQADLLAFLFPSHNNPVFQWLLPDDFPLDISWVWPLYLGIVPLLLVSAALFGKVERRQTRVWWIMAGVFIVLMLGAAPRINHRVYTTVRLPAYYLVWFPAVSIVRRADFFMVGFLLPYSILAAFGAEHLLKRLRWRSEYGRLLLIAGLSVFLMLEYWEGPYPQHDIAPSPFYATIEGQEGAIIDLPMGRQLAKYYMYLASEHRHPIVEGLASRTPPEAYDYIEGNLVLSGWMQRDRVTCSGADVLAAARQLEDDGFKYVILHNRWQSRAYSPDELSGTLLGDTTPFYTDTHIIVYAVADIVAECQSRLKE
jgi:hypothetical protein